MTEETAKALAMALIMTHTNEHEMGESEGLWFCRTCAERIGNQLTKAYEAGVADGAKCAHVLDYEVGSGEPLRCGRCGHGMGS